jgi:hypothetical protein
MSEDTALPEIAAPSSGRADPSSMGVGLAWAVTIAEASTAMGGSRMQECSLEGAMAPRR